MESSLILKLHRGEPFSTADIDGFRLAIFAFLNEDIPIEKSFRLTKLDLIKERNRHLLELGRWLLPRGELTLAVRPVARAIHVFQRQKWPASKDKNRPPPNFTKGECLLFWAHKVMPKMPDEKQLTNIFTSSYAENKITL